MQMRARHAMSGSSSLLSSFPHHVAYILSICARHTVSAYPKRPSFQIRKKLTSVAWTLLSWPLTLARIDKTGLNQFWYCVSLNIKHRCLSGSASVQTGLRRMRESKEHDDSVSHMLVSHCTFICHSDESYNCDNISRGDSAMVLWYPSPALKDLHRSFFSCIVRCRLKRQGKCSILKEQRIGGHSYHLSSFYAVNVGSVICRNTLEY